MKSNNSIFVGIIFLGIIIVSYSFVVQGVKNIVPNEETAIKIAEAVALPIYGNDILKERPFSARLINDSIWIVNGSRKGIEVDGMIIRKDTTINGLLYVIKGGCYM